MGARHRVWEVVRARGWLSMRVSELSVALCDLHLPCVCCRRDSSRRRVGAAARFGCVWLRGMTVWAEPCVVSEWVSEWVSELFAILDRDWIGLCKQEYILCLSSILSPCLFCFRERDVPDREEWHFELSGRQIICGVNNRKKRTWAVELRIMKWHESVFKKVIVELSNCQFSNL